MRYAPPMTVLGAGRGSATALIHGALSSPAFWHQPLPRRVLSGRTLSYPLPGHFPWVLDDGTLTRILNPRALADTYALALRRDFYGQPVHLIGHSTGGYVALLIATYHPKLVSRLTLAGSFADARVAGGSPLLKSLLHSNIYGALAVEALLATWLSTRALYNAGLSSVVVDAKAPWQNPLFARHSDLVRDDLLQSNFKQLISVGRWFSDQRMRMDLARVRQPTLVLAGDADPVVPFAHQRSIARALPNARFAPLSKVGHIPMAEHARAYNAHIDAFVSTR
ncbi:MAG: alpha/beta hydrolase [Pseudomonadota bacterium]